MTMEKPKSHPSGDRRGRRPYAPPAVEETASFETLALACGKTTSDNTCAYNEGGLRNS